MTFSAPTGLAGTNPSGLNVDLTWTAPPGIGAPQLLLHMDTSAFADSSPNNLTMTAGASAVFDTSAPKFGAGDLSSPGINAITCLHTPIVTGNPIDLTSIASWTIEGWIKPAVMGGFSQFFISFGVHASGGGFTGITLASSGAGQTGPNTADLQFQVYGQTSGGGQYLGIGGVTAGAWHHFAMVKQPSGSGCDQYQLFIDGVGTGWTPATVGAHGYVGPYLSWAGYAVFGSYYDTAGGFQAGNVSNDGVSFDEIRVSNYTVYTANFTPPTAPFPNSGTAPTGYDIYRNSVSVATTVGGPGYNDVVPTSGTYTYTVAAQTSGVDSSPQSSPFTITIGSTMGTQPNFLNDEFICGAYVNSKLTLVEYVYLPEREPFLASYSPMIINRYVQEPTDSRQRGVDYTYFVVPGELIQTVAVTGISAQGVPQANTSPLVTPLVVSNLILDPATQLKFAYTVSGGQDGIEYEVQFTTTTQVQTSTVEEVFSIRFFVRDEFP